MRCWAVMVSEDRFADERLYAFPGLVLPDNSDAADPGDQVALIVAGPTPKLFALGEVRAGQPHPTIAYTQRLFDHPIAVADLLPAGPAAGATAFVGGLVELDADRYAALAARAEPGIAAGAAGRPTGTKPQWFVSVTLPIEAVSRADAVREFWTYLADLGPRELPAFVWPRSNELAMQAFLDGSEAPQDPEDD